MTRKKTVVPASGAVPAIVPVLVVTQDMSMVMLLAMVTVYVLPLRHTPMYALCELANLLVDVVAPAALDSVVRFAPAATLFVSICASTRESGGGACKKGARTLEEDGRIRDEAMLRECRLAYIVRRDAKPRSR
jgi:hypothetical protein